MNYFFWGFFLVVVVIIRVFLIKVIYLIVFGFIFLEINEVLVKYILKLIYLKLEY